MKKLRIEVWRVDHDNDAYAVVKVIFRKPWMEAIGNFNPINFNPMFCRYQGKRTLVQSSDGDLSDPFRREEKYLKTLYIEEPKGKEMK